MYVNIDEEIRTESLDDYSNYFRSLSYDDDYEDIEYTPFNTDIHQIPFVLNPYYMPIGSELVDSQDMRKKKKSKSNPRPPYPMNPYPMNPYWNHGYGYGYPYHPYPNQGFNPLPWFLLGSIL
ncbi:hypothetical protein D3C81_1050890 [compost metagenome]